MTSIVEVIERAALRYKERLDAEEARAKGPKPKPYPLPTKKEAWDAFATDLADREVPIDAAAQKAFERWWRAEDEPCGHRRTVA
jgi:hypothetical protein